MLSEEHKKILKVIDALLNECDSLKNGKEINKAFFIGAIDFIKNFADKFHHAKEEDILFKEFNKCANRGGVHCNPIEQMINEHNEGRNYVKKMEESLNKNGKERVVENARGYAQLLRDHIFKEDNILYPMVDQISGNREKDIILNKFEEINKNLEQEIKKHLFIF